MERFSPARATAAGGERCLIAARPTGQAPCEIPGVIGVKEAFGFEPDLVCGRATNTQAGVTLVEKLTGVEAIDVLDPSSEARLARVLADRLASSPVPTSPS